MSKNTVAFWVTQCTDAKDSQGAELRHVVETGDWNAADVVVVQRAGRVRIGRSRPRKRRKQENKMAEGGMRRKERGLFYCENNQAATKPQRVKTEPAHGDGSVLKCFSLKVIFQDTHRTSSDRRALNAPSSIQLTWFLSS